MNGDIICTSLRLHLICSVSPHVGPSIDRPLRVTCRDSLSNVQMSTDNRSFTVAEESIFVFGGAVNPKHTESLS